MADFNFTTAGTGANPPVYNQPPASVGYASLASQFGSVINTLGAGYSAYIMAKHNAAMAGYEQQWQDIQTEQELELLHDEEARILGNNRAVAGGSGFSVASKTNVDLERDVMREVGKEAAVIRTRGSIENMRTEVKKDAFKTKANNIQTSTALKAFTSLSKIPESKAGRNFFQKA